jgi:hypothetical protein
MFGLDYSFKRTTSYIDIPLLIIWAIGYFGFSAGYLIHALIVIVVIVVLARVISGNKA